MGWRQLDSKTQKVTSLFPGQGKLVNKMEKSTISQLKSSSAMFVNDNYFILRSSSEASLFRAYIDASEHIPTVEYRTSPLDGTTQVPELLYSTIDIPKNVHHVGKGTLVQAR